MSYLPSATWSAAFASSSTGVAIRRERYQASTPETISPTPSATKSSSTSEIQPWVSAVFGFATISAPNVGLFEPASWSGWPTARKLLCSPGGVKSNVITCPSCSASQSTADCGSWRSPDAWPGKIGTPT